ncbi:MAG: TlpA family protein disulfide reductase [Microthrixaceae bacterium]|nr:TlpA family protein disulfide reductase [Microthrixaceae bacterium]
MRRPLVLLTLMASVSVAASACGSDDDTASSAPGASEQAESDAPVEMIDVATGETSTLDDALTPTDGKPLLAWFWAPFCPTCRGEAPELDAFMAENSNRVTMVGVGARNDLEYAEEFLGTTGVSNFPLLWDASGESWVDNAVAAQPYMILFDSEGEEVQRWPGGASVVQIENALAELG